MRTLDLWGTLALVLSLAASVIVAAWADRE